MKGIVHRRTHRHHPMVGHHQRGCVADRAGQAIAFLQIRRRPGRRVVIGDTMVHQQVVVMCHAHPPALDHRQCGQIGRMQVNGAFRRRVGRMDRGMDVIGHRAHLAPARDHIALEIDHQQVARGDLLEQQPAPVDQEAVLAVRHHQAEMIAQALVEAEPHRKPERRREVAAHPPFHIAHLRRLAHGPLRQDLRETLGQTLAGGYPRRLSPPTGPRCRQSPRARSARIFEPCHSRSAATRRRNR